MVVSSADMPRIVGLCSPAPPDTSRPVVDADVDDLEAGAFHHHADQVLADVVDVALDGADHHGALLGRAGFSQQRTQDNHTALHGVGCQKHLWNKQDAVTEIDADNTHAFDKRFGQNPVRLPLALQQNIDAFKDLVGKAVIEILVHLLDKFIVVQGGEI